MKPKLISFKLCPFVQKATLTLLQKQVDFDIEYINPSEPPEWFSKISPLGNVPVLVVGDDVLFESSVIVEYLDEVNAPSLHPADPLKKANNRAWMEFGNQCLANVFNMIVAADETGYNEQREALLSKFDQLNNHLHQSPYFNGADLSLVDISFIPLFQRLSFLDEVAPGLLDKTRHPKVMAWADTLLALDTVPQSAVPELPQIYMGMAKMRNGHFASLMG